LDGELPSAEARAMAERLARDSAAAALLTELRQTRQAVAEFEKTISLPESREFFWAKIQRDIQRQDARAGTSSASSRVPFRVRLRRLLMPATGLALLAIAALVATQGLPGGHRLGLGGETSVADSGAFTYHDDSAGTTLVWLSYPAEGEASEDAGAAYLE
ncbi:MAG TPA: hypothetical protein VNZ22_23330, partial [Bacillota bacterium]|nr:hypothetical protein [Bacillota bacterium]